MFITEKNWIRHNYITIDELGRVIMVYSNKETLGIHAAAYCAVKEDVGTQENAYNAVWNVTGLVI